MCLYLLSAEERRGTPVGFLYQESAVGRVGCTIHIKELKAKRPSSCLGLQVRIKKAYNQKGLSDSLPTNY